MEASGSDSGGNPEQDLGPDPPIEPNPGQDIEMEQEEEAYPEEENNLRLLDYDGFFEKTSLLQGNFGKIWMAKHHSFGKLYVALKIFNGSNDDETRSECFNTDVSSLGKFSLNHENIIRLLGICGRGQPLCVVMEYVSLHTNENPYNNLDHFLWILRKEIKKDTPSGFVDLELYPRLLHDFAKQIAEGMEYLHELTIIHGDLSTRNILLRKYTIKISDYHFHFMKEHLRNSGVSDPMSYRCTAPEVIIGHNVSYESDVYSYGVLLWRMACLGGLPFSNLSDDEIYAALLEEILEQPDLPVHFNHDARDIIDYSYYSDHSGRYTFTEILSRMNEVEQAGQLCFLDFSNVTPEFFPPNECTSSFTPKGPHMIDPLRLITIWDLGTGNFGSVRLMKKRETFMGHDTFAAKYLICTDFEKLKTFWFEEVKILERVGLHHHPNIVRILGYFQTGFQVGIVMEYVSFEFNGEEITSLYQYLLILREEFQKIDDARKKGENKRFSESEILNNTDLETFAMQIAEAMAYLEEKGIVHSNLTSRNVLIGRNKILKVTDFGYQGRGCYLIESNEQQQSYLARWASLELICNKEYSHKSDVWAYGITLWEIAMLGGYPYHTLLEEEDVRNEIENGRLLRKPSNITDEFYVVMAKCWDPKPEDRSSFEEVWGAILSLTGSTFIDFDQIPGYLDLPPTANDLGLATESLDDQNVGPTPSQPSQMLPIPPSPAKSTSELLDPGYTANVSRYEEPAQKKSDEKISGSTGAIPRTQPKEQPSTKESHHTESRGKKPENLEKEEYVSQDKSSSSQAPSYEKEHAESLQINLNAPNIQYDPHGNYCKQCGRELSPGTLFCPNCYVDDENKLE